MLISKTEMILNNLNSLATGEIKFVGKTTKTALKKPRKQFTSEEFIPERFQTITKYTYITSKIATSYPHEVNVVRGQEGKNTTFRSKETYCVPVDENLVVWKHKEKDQLYIRMYPFQCEEFETRSVYFDHNGEQLTSEEYNEAFQKYISGWQDPEKSKQAKQASQGVDKPIEVRNWKIEGVVFLQDNQNNIIINELTDDLLKLFN